MFVDEELDGGRSTAASGSGNYILQDACDPVYNQNTSSNGYILNQGTYFNIYRDLLPPAAVTFFNSSVRPDGNVALAWNAVTDQENQVWGYRVYRSFYYGPSKFQTRLVDAPNNTSAAFVDTNDLLFGLQYFYEVRAVDGALNEQTAGNKILPFTVVKRANSVVDLVAVSKAGGDIDLSWSAVAGAAYYKIYRSTTFGERGVCITPGTDVVLPGYSDNKTGLTGGTRYFYVAQAVVASAEETKNNNQASAICDKNGPNAPLVSSLTHPVQGQPYANANPAFRWVASADPGINFNVAGYCVKIDSSPNTGSVVTGAGWGFVTDLTKRYFGINNGVWYFHCLAQDQSGNLGNEAVYCVNILATGSVLGTVLEAPSQAPMAGVIAEAWLGTVKQGECALDALGKYRLDNLPFGDYTLKFNRFGFKPLEKSTTLNLNNTPLTLDATWAHEDVIAHNQTAAYPNPATGDEVRMIYYCEQPCEVLIEIYDLLGQMVGRIKEEQKPQGYNYSAWPLHNVARGVYLFRVKMRTPDGRHIVLPTKKFGVIK
ncbi:MAG: T9SS type A sorting domain-containing protein [Candidatus Firestonebacteria bacterium]|nr:T9SS type A sorting domain-containing protein [Candidatus Firestonebacteria bacterium]